MHVKPNALLSKKVTENDSLSTKKALPVFGIFALLSVVLLIFFLDTRLKKYHPTYEDYLRISFDDPDLPTGFQSDATLRHDGTGGYLYFDDLGQILRTPKTGVHASYRVFFRVAVLNVAAPEPYNESNPTWKLGAYNDKGFLVDSALFYNPQVNTTLSATFLNAETIDYFVLTLQDYAAFSGYQAYAGIDDLIIQTPREE